MASESKAPATPERAGGNSDTDDDISEFATPELKEKLQHRRRVSRIFASPIKRESIGYRQTLAATKIQSLIRGWVSRKKTKRFVSGLEKTIAESGTDMPSNKTSIAGSSNILESPEKQWYVSTFSSEIQEVQRLRRESMEDLRSSITSESKYSKNVDDKYDLEYDVTCMIHNSMDTSTSFEPYNRILRRMLVCDFLCAYENEVHSEIILAMLVYASSKRSAANKFIMTSHMEDVIGEFVDGKSYNSRFAHEILKVDFYLNACAKAYEQRSQGIESSLLPACPENLFSKVGKAVCRKIEETYREKFQRALEIEKERAEKSKLGSTPSFVQQTSAVVGLIAVLGMATAIFRGRTT